MSVCPHCAVAAADLTETRAKTNRIRVDAKQQIADVIDILNVALHLDNPEEWLANARLDLADLSRTLDKLPRN